MNEDKENSSSGVFRNTPTIPSEVYANLPESLQSVTKHFTHPREKDVVLLSTIGVLSGMFPKLKGTYDNRQLYANLFLFISAPAASFKGSMNWSKQLGYKVHSEMLESYRAQLDKFKSKKRKSKKNADDAQEMEPPKKTILFMPANSSSAAVISHLDDNNGVGILFESEADTLSSTLKSDWGNYSDMMRKTFHHESISASRIVNNVYVEIETPKLSIVLSGTIAQIQRLLPNTEDGLFSRFMFYAYSMDASWRDVTPRANVDLYSEFKQYDNHFYEMRKEYLKEEISFTLAAEQWKQLNSHFEERLKTESSLSGENTRSIVIRLGIICFRISMILCAIRSYETKTISNVLYCDDRDFSTSLSICEVVLQHALTVLGNLEKPHSNRSATNTALEEFFLKLPEQFQRKDAVEQIAKGLAISSRASDKYLKQLLQQNRLAQPRYGQYIKVESTT